MTPREHFNRMDHDCKTSQTMILTACPAGATWVLTLPKLPGYTTNACGPAKIGDLSKVSRQAYGPEGPSDLYDTFGIHPVYL